MTVDFGYMDLMQEHTLSKTHSCTLLFVKHAWTGQHTAC